MKKRILPIVLFILILGIYVVVISNFDIFLTNYDNDLMTVNNNYKINDEETYDFLGEILYNSSVRLATTEDIESIENKELLANIITDFYEEEDAITYLEMLAQDDELLIYDNSSYNEDIIYITKGDSLFLFTKDFQNIYYNYTPFNEASLPESTKNIFTIEEISNMINNKLRVMGISNIIQFKMSSITKSQIEYDYLDNHAIYYIEDDTNNIDITYDASIDKIFNLQIGFNH